MIENGKRLLTTRETAERIGMSPSWVEKAVAAGEFIEPIRLGRRVLFDLNKLDRWIDAGCPRTNSVA